MSERNVDDQIRTLQEKRRELQALGEKLRESAHPVAVCFVDLADSTAIKIKLPPDEWLGYIYEFLAAVGKHADSSGGTVVKRIGDELMLSFPDTNSSEQFLACLEADLDMQPGSFKVSLDFGEAYFLRFAKGLEDDPYGTVVDRCARIAKLARPGAVLCSAAYHRAVGGGPYVSAGQFPMKGLPEPEEVFLRQPPAAAADYVRPLLDALNDPSGKSEGYTSLPRHFDEAYVASLGRSRARPFIARALLNVPRLPDTPQALEHRLMGPQGDQESKRVRGYYIDWLVSFKTYEVKSDEIQVSARIPGNQWCSSVWVIMVPSMLEIVQGLTVEQRLQLRGILMEVFGGVFWVNYADFEVLENG
jgi:class 3 adenylate cyclase